MRNERIVVAAMAAFFFVASLAAQGEAEGPDTRERDLDAQVVELLHGFARKAAVNRQYSRARDAWTMLLADYDSEFVPAHKGLGRRKVKGEWQDGSREAREDDPDSRKRAQVEKAWRAAAAEIGALHGELGLKLLGEGHIARANRQLERALRFMPDERRWHEGLGHKEIDGYFGTEQQVAFVQRMREIREKANELREKTYELTELDMSRLPATLKRTGIQFVGAKSKHFTHWVAGAQTEVNDSLQWAERCYELLEFLLGRQRHALQPTAVRWYAILQDHEQRDLLFAKSPEVTGKLTPDQARMFGGSTFDVGGGWAHVSWSHHDSREDSIVAHVARRHFLQSRNMGLSEGVMHFCTYLICGTTLTYYGNLPHTVTADYVFMERKPGAWLARMEEEVEQGKDWPLDQLARERADNFRDSARVKAWAFMGWVIARYPHAWFKLVDTMGPTKELMPELAAKRYEEALGKSMYDLQAEWREWALRDSKQREASGF